MHSKKHILAFITAKKDQKKTNKEVARIHLYFEAYLKHIALTALRINGGKYKESRSYIVHSWIPCNADNIKKILLKLFNSRQKKAIWDKVLKEQACLKIALDLLFRYAIPIRNQIAHGNYYPYKEGEEELIFDIYIQVITTLEKTIANRKKGNKILSNTATQFGAKRGTLSTKGQLQNILKFSDAGNGYSFEKAKKIFQQLK